LLKLKMNFNFKTDNTPGSCPEFVTTITLAKFICEWSRRDFEVQMGWKEIDRNCKLSTRVIVPPFAPSTMQADGVVRGTGLPARQKLA
jgi:hypothetical protein